MDKLEKIYNAVFITFIIILIYILAYHYLTDETVVPDFSDENSNRDLASYIRKEIRANSNTPPTLKKIIKSMLSGAIRGALMGLALNGVEGAITSAIVLGTINPLITSVEHKF